MKKNTVLFLIVFFFSNSFLFTAEKYRNVPDYEVINRIQEIQGALDSGKKNANLWWYGWLYGYTALGTAQMGLYLFTPENTKNDQIFREEMLVGSIVTYLGALGQLIDPMVPGYAPDRIRNMPESTEEERRKKLAEAEKYFMAAAQRERSGRSFLTQSINVGINLAGSLVLYFALKHTLESALVNFLIGTAITEVQIFTQPIQAIRDWNVYAKHYGLEDRIVYVSPQNWNIAMGFGTLVAQGRFD